MPNYARPDWNVDVYKRQAYDTTDHNQDGYVIESFERLVYGWYSSYDEDNMHNEFIVAFPKSQHEDVVKALDLN